MLHSTECKFDRRAMGHCCMFLSITLIVILQGYRKKSLKDILILLNYLKQNKIDACYITLVKYGHYGKW